MNISHSKVKWRVLVFPAGTENAVEIWRALSPCKEVLLFAAASGMVNHMPFLFNRCNIVPSVTGDGDWIGALNGIIADNGIDFIFPANDDVIEALNDHRGRIDCPLLLPPSETVAISRSKTKTKDALRGLLPIVRMPGADGAPSTPFAVKPDKSFGAKGFRVIEKAFDARRGPAPGMIAEEHLPGREFSVDCFTDRRGNLLFSSGRVRARVRMGTTVYGVLADDTVQNVLREWAEKISAKLSMRGAWFFQAKEDHSGQLRFTEVDVRIAGTMALNRVRGVNFPLLTLYDAAGADVSIGCLLEDRSIAIGRELNNRYAHQMQYDTVYVDWDDTLIVRGRINLELVKFLFQCVNQNVRIKLLTQSTSADLAEEIAHYRLSELFDEIIHIPETEDKHLHISGGNAIFIDDSHSHRQKVHEARNIPCFSPDMVEVLLSARVE